MMLADGAHQADGKLYVLGGQFDTIGAKNFPVVHAMLAMVIVIRVEYPEAQIEHRWQLELRTEDGEPVGVGASGQFTAGHAAEAKKGDPTFIPVAIPFQGTRFDGPGHFEWRLSINDDQVVRSLPLVVKKV